MSEPCDKNGVETACGRLTIRPAICLHLRRRLKHGMHTRIILHFVYFHSFLYVYRNDFFYVLAIQLDWLVLRQALEIWSESTCTFSTRRTENNSDKDRFPCACIVYSCILVSSELSCTSLNTGMRHISAETLLVQVMLSGKHQDS